MENTGTEADKATVASHLRRRAGMDFVTVEQGRNILQCLERTDPEGTFLIDSVTTLVTNELFPPDKNYETELEKNVEGGHWISCSPFVNGYAVCFVTAAAADGASSKQRSRRRQRCGRY